MTFQGLEGPTQKSQRLPRNRRLGGVFRIEQCRVQHRTQRRIQQTKLTKWPRWIHEFSMKIRILISWLRALQTNTEAQLQINIGGSTRRSHSVMRPAKLPQKKRDRSEGGRPIGQQPLVWSRSAHLANFFLHPPDKGRSFCRCFFLWGSGSDVTDEVFRNGRSVLPNKRSLQ